MELSGHRGPCGQTLRSRADLQSHERCCHVVRLVTAPCRHLPASEEQFPGRGRGGGGTLPARGTGQPGMKC